MDTRNRKQNKSAGKQKDVHKFQKISEKKKTERIISGDCNESDSDISSDNEELETPRFINNHEDNSEELENPEFINNNKYDSKETSKNKNKIILVCTIMTMIILGLFCWKCLWSSSPVSGYLGGVNTMMLGFPSQTKTTWKMLNNFLATQILSKIKFLNRNSSNQSSPVLDYLAGFNKMMLEFPSQTKITWKMLNNSLATQILRAESAEKPSVIILVGQRDKINNFLETLIKLVLDKCPTYKQTIATENADDLKMYLTDFLDNLVGNGTRCAYLPEIDNIPPSLGPLLHRLTHELHAKYKQMIYIFSLITNPNNENLESPPDTVKDAEKLLKHRLSLKWEQEQGTERFVALHTRLLVNVVNIM